MRTGSTATRRRAARKGCLATASGFAETGAVAGSFLTKQAPRAVFFERAWYLFYAMGLLCAGMVMGCRGNVSEKPPIHPQRNMFTQDKGRPLRENKFFEDGRTMRTPVEGTVAMEAPDDPTDAYHTGLTTGQSTPLAKSPTRACPECVKDNPRPTTWDLLKSGQSRYNISCAPCHGLQGDGQGSVMLRVNGKGWNMPPSYHQDDFLNAPDGYLFYVGANGISTMPAYKNFVNPDDLWATVAYIRALQRSRSTPLSDLSPSQRSQLP